MTLILLLTFSGCNVGCGSGSDEITISCINNGPGDIACGANGGSSIDRNVATPVAGVNVQ